MNLKEYAEKINKLAQKHPEAGIVYQAGEYWLPVNFKPMPGLMDGDEFTPFCPEEAIDTVCIN